MNIRTFSSELLPENTSMRKPLLLIGAGVTGVFAIVKIYESYKNAAKINRRSVSHCLILTGFINCILNRKKWASVERDKVVLHQFSRSSTVTPSPSPFVLKLETYLRMAKIPYEVI